MQDLKIIRYNGFRAEYEQVSPSLFIGTILDMQTTEEFSANSYDELCLNFRHIVMNFLRETIETV